MITSKDLPANFFDLLPQSAVRASVFPKDGPQNSIWDFIRTPSGRFFVSLCAEGAFPSSGQVFEYLPSDGRLRLCFDLQKVCMVTSRAIPPSKIHSSMDLMPDGRIIMATHNTAPAPGHPYWLFDAYYPHIWEGFPGSNLIIFDPATNEARNLGIPVPRESIYGGVYDARHNVYYAIGYGRGHLYRHELDSATTLDLGQVSECGSFRLTHGPDGNIYGTTRTGWIYRIDVDRQQVVELGVQLPNRPDYPARAQYAIGVTGPDGRLYMAHHVSDLLSALDVKTGRLEVLGSCDPGPIVKDNYPRCPNGLNFDDAGVLWMALSGPALGHWSHLIRWDVTRGGKPESVGLIGTVNRSAWFCSEIIRDRNILYVAETNHLEDPPAILRIDLDAVQRDAKKPRERTKDPVAYGLLDDSQTAYGGPVEDLERLLKMKQQGAVAGEFGSKNTITIQAKEIVVHRLWRHLPAAESSVRKLQWLDNHRLRGVTATGEPRAFVCALDGTFTLLDPVASKVADAEIPEPAGIAAHTKALGNLVLPHRQGRQYLATASCCAPWRDGQLLVGTKDGMLARVDLRNQAVFALGAVATNGPVHQIVTNAARTVAYGVAGDEWDLGNCFRYDDIHGVWEMGRTYTFEGTVPGLANSCQPCCVALSPDEISLAIGAADRLGTVYVYRDVKFQ